MFLYELDQEGDIYLLKSTQSFDYEQPNQRNYYFGVYEKTNSVNSTKVLLNIRNIDDEPPTLVSPQCSFEVSITSIEILCAYLI